MGFRSNRLEEAMSVCKKCRGWLSVVWIGKDDKPVRQCVVCGTRQ